ncbi:MAG TPA: hypothetical protein VNA89_07720, partial [Gemmatimonadaceae bacterium]|nr:hypothetical protein [Gemmatimonadaceae bacterium]
ARVAAGYMTALALAGNTTGAIQHARVHEAVVRAELDAPPDAAVTRLAEQLRTGGAAAIAPPGPARAVAPASRAGPGIASPSRRLSLAMLFTMRRSSPQRLMTTTVTHEVSAARTAARRAMMRRAAAGIAVGALAAALWALLAS